MSEGNLFSRVVQMDIEKEVKKSFLDYSMSVIVSRAIPDVRDGLKPVHRRILYALYDQGITHEKAHKKSANIVGEVMGKYHPHGDSSIYQAMVKMTQDFNYRYPLIEGQGNFGSIDGDDAGAQRYCFTGDTRVMTDMGLVKIEDIPSIINADKKSTEINISSMVNSIDDSQKAVK